MPRKTITRALVPGIALAVTLATVGLSAQRIAVGFKPGPWDLKPTGADPMPEEGPIVRVPFDKTRRGYVAVRPDYLMVKAALRGDCAGLGEKHAELHLSIAGQEAQIWGFREEQRGLFEGVGTGRTKETVNHFVRKVVPADPVAMCNADLETLLKGGQYGKAQKGWARQFDHAMKVAMTLECHEKDRKRRGSLFTEVGELRETTTTVDYPVWVFCGPAAVFETTKGGGRPPVRATGVQTVEVWVNPKSQANYTGPCPKDLAFGGAIEFAGMRGTSSTVRYRYRTHDGATSPVYTVDFDGSGRKNLHFWRREFGGSDPSGTIAAPGVKPSGKGIKGWVEIEVLDGSRVSAQDRMPFSITCAKPGIGGITGRRP